MPKGPGGVFYFVEQITEQPSAQPQRAMVFIDGQNLYRSVKDAFDYSYPNYNVLALAKKTCELAGGCFLAGVRFYTGFPDGKDDPMWNSFWSKKLLAISRQGVIAFSRSLRYRNEVIDLGHGSTVERRMGREKGIDVRIALDLVRYAVEQSYDVAVVFSQDQDLSEATDEVKRIARTQNRKVRLVSAYPWRSGYYRNMNDKGINGTDWLRIDQPTYDACIDPFDYRTGAKRT